MKSFLISSLLSLLCLLCNGQIYITSGKITYERRTNIWAGMPDNFFEGFKNTIPQWQTDEFTLTFTADKALYQPVGEIEKHTYSLPATDNIVFTDFKKGISISAKNIFDKNYIIEKGLRHATWKIKDDFRDIAGFNCRRATTIILDSVFVVAFYTEEIIPSVGPESFTGLPGAILGLVINRLHTTWYATRLDASVPDTAGIKPPSGRNIMNDIQFKETMKKTSAADKAPVDTVLWAVTLE